MKRRFFLPLFLMILINNLVAGQDKQINNIYIYPQDIFCKDFIGIGVQWSAYPHADSETAEWGFLMTKEKWDTLYNRMDYMKPRIIRVIDQANWRYFKTLDKEGKPIIQFDNQEISSLYKILDYCQKNDISVIIGEWGVPGQKHDKDKPDIRLRDASDKRWISMIAEWIDFLINKKGYSCIKYYDFINEPNGIWASTEGDFAEWALGIKLLSEEFKTRKLNKLIKIIGPGTVPNYTAPQFGNKYKGNEWVKYTSEVLGREVKLYDTHAYLPHMVVRNGDAAKYIYLGEDIAIANKDKKPFLLTELGLKSSKDTGAFATENEKRRVADGNTALDCNMYVYDYFYGIDITSAALQCLLAGVDGIIAWDVDDAMHTKDDMGDKRQ